MRPASDTIPTLSILCLDVLNLHELTYIDHLAKPFSSDILWFQAKLQELLLNQHQENILHMRYLWSLRSAQWRLDHRVKKRGRLEVVDRTHYVKDLSLVSCKWCCFVHCTILLKTMMGSVDCSTSQIAKIEKSIIYLTFTFQLSECLHCILWFQ